MPLLIGGATTSRAHTALKIDPHYKSPTVWVKDASRAVGVAQSLISQGAARELRRRQRRRLCRDPRAPQAIAATPSGWCRWRRRARRRFDGGWDDYTPPAPQQAGHHRVRRLPAGRAGRTASTGRRSSRPGNWRASIRRSSTDAVVGDAGQRVVRDARAMLEADRRGEMADGEGGVRLVAGEQRRRRRRASMTGDRRRPAHALHFLRQQVDKPVERPDFCLADFIAPKAQRQAGLDRRLRRHRRHRHRDARRALRSRPRRLQRDPAQGAGRPSGRSARRTPAPARAQGVLGLRAGRSARQRSADRREVPRHPPRPGLSGLPRAQREGDAVRAARCRRRTPA